MYKTDEDAEDAYMLLKSFYRGRIALAVESAGSVNALAKKLGKATSSVRHVIERNKFGPMRKLAIEVANREDL